MTAIASREQNLNMGRIGTVGEFLDSRTGFGAHCLGCRHYVVVDMERLAEQRGRDLQIVGAETPFRRALRCSKCGSRDIQITVIASTPSMTGPIPR
ncbi:hypothetical protein [Kaistia sp. MMO-174]|uniref:hypothetical protein n=1 Tax=Kaistia sp. MMO-174 TaxID=3081256 RepID=UPI00301640F6